MTDPTAPIPFETALEKLQQTVKKLESGELSLEESLKGFEEGVRLTRVCQEHLSTAEKRVEILMKSSSQNGESTDSKPEFQSFNPSSGRNDRS